MFCHECIGDRAVFSECSSSADFVEAHEPRVAHYISGHYCCQPASDPVWRCFGHGQRSPSRGHYVRWNRPAPPVGVSPLSAVSRPNLCDGGAVRVSTAALIGSSSILSVSSGNGRCDALASSHGVRGLLGVLPPLSRQSGNQVVGWTGRRVENHPSPTSHLRYPGKAHALIEAFAESKVAWVIAECSVAEATDGETWIDHKPSLCSGPRPIQRAEQR